MKCQASMGTETLANWATDMRRRPLGGGAASCSGPRSTRRTILKRPTSGAMALSRDALGRCAEKSW